MEQGALAPEFALLDESGVTRRLSEFLVAGPAVLFFYPAAMTKGCTAESCHFRDLAAAFAALHAQRVGISADPLERQAEFSRRYDFDFPLLADVDGEVATAFGVRRAFGPLRRRTFVIGRDRRVLAVIKSEVRMRRHADRALEILAEERARS